jgi:heme-degrading monooxygenase HmoA
MVLSTHGIREFRRVGAPIGSPDQPLLSLVTTAPAGIRGMRSGSVRQMSVVKINAISVPEGMGPELEQRFATRAKVVETMPGFEGFELLRPTDGESRYFVYTRWASEEAFEGWIASEQFRHGHARAESSDGRPVSHGADLLSFEVVQRL